MPRKPLRKLDIVTVNAAALGEQWAKENFPETWQTAQVQGWVKDEEPVGLRLVARGVSGWPRARRQPRSD